MEGENVKALAPPFNLPLPRGSTPSPILHRGLCWRPKKLWRIYPTSVPSLSVMPCLLLLLR